MAGRSPSMWQRIFCTSDCPHCSVLVDGQRPEDGTSESGEEESVPGVDVENLPPMNYYAEEQLATLKAPAAASSIPWATLQGPHEGSRDSHDGSTRGASSFSGFSASGGPALRAVSSTPGARSRSPAASVNPCSRFGFITVTFPADKYPPDPYDPMDVELGLALASLDSEFASALMLRRLKSGRYEIEGRIVGVRWAGGDRATSSGLLAREEGPDGEDLGSEEVPLQEYLEQTASIAARIRHPAQERTLTFPDARADDRFQSMEIACKQAQMREQAAEACRQSFPLLTPPHLPRPLPGLCSPLPGERPLMPMALGQGLLSMRL